MISDPWYLLRIQCREHSYAYCDIKVSDLLDPPDQDEIVTEVKRIARSAPVLRQHECGDDQLAVFNITPMAMGLG